MIDTTLTGIFEAAPCDGLSIFSVKTSPHIDHTHTHRGGGRVASEKRDETNTPIAPSIDLSLLAAVKI